MKGATDTNDLYGQICNLLDSENAIRELGLLPYSFLEVYREIMDIPSGNTSFVMGTLEKNMRKSAANFKGFHNDDRMLVACDVSGSMLCPIRPKSKIRLFDIGIILGSYLRMHYDNVVTGIIGNDWNVLDFPTGDIVSLINEMENSLDCMVHSVNALKVIEWLLDKKFVMDKVMIFTDERLWGGDGSGKHFASLWAQYKEIVPDAKLYVFDLAGYGFSSLRVAEDGVYLLAGCEERFFNILSGEEMDLSVA